MHKSLFRWRLGATALIICLMLAFNTVVILAQDATDEPPAAITEPTETETPLPIPTDIPTDIPTAEAPTDVPTDIPVEVTESPVATEETLTPEATEVATEAVTEAPPTEATAETPTVVAPVTEEPDLSLLVRELFDNNDLSPWLSGAGWSLAASEGGLALQVVNSNDPIVLQKGAFYNVAVQTRFLWTTGSAQISVRKTAVGNYTASIDALGNISLKRADGVVATSVVASVPAGTWRTLRLSAMNDMIRVAVDDVEVITYSDIAPLPPGDVSLSADFNPAAGDTNPTPEVQTLLADDFFLWVPLTELGLYPVPTPISAPTAAPTEPPPTEVPTEVVIETTAEPTEVVVEPTEVPTEVVTEVPATETEVAPVKQAGPHDDLTQAVGKDVSEVAPPSPEELANAQAPGNDTFALRQSVSPLVNGYFVFTGDTTGADPTTPFLETNEPVPICGKNLQHTVWFKFTPGASGKYTFSTAGSSFDTIMGVYTDNVLNSLDAFGCNDDASSSVITSQLVLDLVGGIEYQIQVGGYSGRFGTYAFRVQQGTTPATLVAPVLNTPVAGITSNQSQPAFKWNKQANANSYEVQVATNTAFTLNLQSAIVNTSACVDPDPCAYAGFVLPSPATYYWRVRGRTLNDVNGAFSAARTYFYRTSAPVLSTPLNNAVVTNSKQPLAWAVYPGAPSYTIQLDQDGDFSTGAVTLPPFTPPSPIAATITYTPTTSQIQGDWYWRVKATPLLSTSDTAYSDSRKFTLNIESAPANNAIINLAGTATSANVTFTWVTVPLATGYTVFTSPNPDMSGATAHPATLPTSLIVPALPGGVYYWYVAPTGFPPPTTPVPPSIVRKFTISQPAPAAPALFAPATGVFTNDTTPFLDWTATTTSPTLGGPFTYDIQIATAATFAPATLINVLPTQTGLTATDYTPTNDLAAGLYYWHVRTVNTHGRASAYSAARTFTVRTYILSAPVDNFVSVNNKPTFTWLAINYPVTTPPVKYRLEVDSATTFNTGAGSNPDYFVENLTTLSHTVPALSAFTNGKWYWRVLVSIDGGATYNVPGPAGDYRTLFVSPSVPVAPILQLPANNGVTNNIGPTLQWKGTTSPLGGPFKYEVQVSTVSNFASSILWSPLVDGAGCSPTIPCTNIIGTPLGQGVYYWRVRTINSIGAPSLYSAVFKFTVDTTPLGIPTQNLLADNAITNLVRPTLSWLTVTGAAKYHIVVNPTNTCAISGGTLVNFTTATPVLSQALTVAVMSTPLAQGQYWWCVESLDPAGNGSGFQASARRFVVNLSNVPADNANVIAPATGIRPSFTWMASGVAGATYTLKVATNPDMTGVVYSSPTPITGLSQAIPTTTAALMYDTYYWQVIVTGAPALDPTIVKRTFIVTPALPVAPVLLLPNTGTSSFTMPLLTWKPVVIPAGATWTVDHYEVQIATNATFTLNFQSFNTPDGATTQQQMPSLSQGTYYWRVRAYNNFNAPGANSAARTFIIDSDGTGIPSLTAPIDNSSSTNKKPNFIWTRPLGAIRFELRYSSNYPASYSPGDQLNTTGTVSITSTTPTTLLTGTSYMPPSNLIPGTYYWQVRAFDAANNPSDWSNLKTFKVFSATGDTPQPNRFGPSDPILLTWGPLSWVTNGAGYYEVQIDNNPIANNVLAPSPEYELRGDPTTTGNGVSYLVYVDLNHYGVVIPAGSLPAGLPNGTWNWHVRGYNPTTHAYGSWSTTGTFVVDK